MKKLYFFTMLSIMLLAVTGATAQKKNQIQTGRFERDLAVVPLCIRISRCSGIVETQ